MGVGIGEQVAHAVGAGVHPGIGVIVGVTVQVCAWDVNLMLKKKKSERQIDTMTHRGR